MLNDAILELTKILIKQDLKDKKEGTEIINIPKKKIISENIKLLKLLQEFEINKNNY